MRLSSITLLSVLLFCSDVLSSSRCKRELNQYICRNHQNEITLLEELSDAGEILKRYRRTQGTGELYLRKTFSYFDLGPQSFQIFNDSGEIVRTFSDSDFDLCKADELPGEYRVLIAEPHGIDISHPDLQARIIAEKRQEVGLRRGECAGLTVTDSDDVVSHFIDFDLENGQDLFRTSHGTMVAGVLLKGHDNLKIYPLGGDLRSRLFYQEITHAIKNYEIDLVNISLSFQPQNNRYQSSRERYAEALGASIEMLEVNPDTLFVVASGNGHFRGISGLNSINIDSHRHYPAAHNADNIFSVGSINTAYLDDENYEDYRMSYFSNYGVRFVDILAPGENLVTTDLGGGETRAVGTSFSTPFIINEMVKIKEIAPHLSFFQIRELMMKTVYIPNIDKALEIDLEWRERFTDEMRKKGEWFPVRSGGIYHREQALRVAKILRDSPEMLINQGVEQVFTPEEFSKRKDLWSLREIGS